MAIKEEEEICNKSITLVWNFIRDYPLCTTSGMWSALSPGSFIEYSSGRPYERSPFLDLFASSTLIRHVKPCFNISLCTNRKNKLYVSPF